jgi:hypothetical protein
MGKLTRYEWDLETWDQHGDVLNHNHADKLKELLFYKGKKPSDFNPEDTEQEYQLVLVKDLWVDGELEGRQYWYPEFEGIDSRYREVRSFKVPKKYEKEFETVWERGRIKNG